MTNLGNAVGGSIAIDGPVASGKTTIARLVARRLGILYVDSGAMYRALAFLALSHGVDVAVEALLVDLLHAYPLKMDVEQTAPRGYRLYAGSAELGDQLFSPEVAAIVSAVAAHPGVRRELVALQRKLAGDAPVVMAGRDIGSVVLPDARHKIFLTASIEVRTRRRLAELRESGMVVDEAALRAQIEERDRLDESRPVAPLVVAPGAVVLDSTELAPSDVAEQICTRVLGRPGREFVR